MASEAGPTDSTDRSEKTYQFTADAETWNQWVNTIPRTQPIHERLTTLIEQDLRAANRDLDDEEEIGAKLLGTFATRIRIRGIQARNAVRDGEDNETAIEQIEEIIDMADVLER